MINNELLALLQMSVAEETCGLQTATSSVAPVLQTNATVTDTTAAANANNNTPNWWWLLLAAAAMYVVTKY